MSNFIRFIPDTNRMYYAIKFYPNKKIDKNVEIYAFVSWQQRNSWVITEEQRLTNYYVYKSSLSLLKKLSTSKTIYKSLEDFINKIRNNTAKWPFLWSGNLHLRLL